MVQHGHKLDERALTTLRTMSKSAFFDREVRLALLFAVESIETLYTVRGECQSDKAIRETELALSGEWPVFEEGKQA